MFWNNRGLALISLASIRAGGDARGARRAHKPASESAQKHPQYATYHHRTPELAATIDLGVFRIVRIVQNTNRLADGECGRITAEGRNEFAFDGTDDEAHPWGIGIIARLADASRTHTNHLDHDSRCALRAGEESKPLRRDDEGEEHREQSQRQQEPAPAAATPCPL